MAKGSVEKEILTIKEAAAYLQIGIRSLYRLAREGRIPGKKVLNKWRFTRKSLQAWIRQGDRKHWE
jgi:excisionase family DNA binding protein